MLYEFNVNQETYFGKDLGNKNKDSKDFFPGV